MKAKKGAAVPVRLKQVCRQFERWRKTKKGHTLIPDPLWEAAVQLAREHGVFRISRTLSLNHTDLKKRVDAGARTIGPRRDSQPTFVELDLHESAPVAECFVEMENERGAKMRIHFKCVDAQGLLALSRTFWSGEA